MTRHNLARLALAIALGVGLPLVLLSTLAAPSFAQGEQSAPETPSEEEIRASIEAFLSQLDFQSGDIELSAAKATLSLGEHGYRFLDARDTERLLVEAWGNPPGMQALGSIVPENFDLVGENTWAVIVSYEADGYVSDEDASAMDYDALLVSMQEDAHATNDQREAAGYGRVELVGWAESPYYDADSHKLYWAKELRFGDADGNTLNYGIRALGRKGVLVLNAVGSMDQFVSIRQGMQDILPRMNFGEGSTYADFDPSIDEVAAYGIGALVAGKLAAKAGLLAKAAPLLLLLKKFWIVGAVALAAIARKVFTSRSEHGPGQGPDPRGGSGIS